MNNTLRWMWMFLWHMAGMMMFMNVWLVFQYRYVQKKRDIYYRMGDHYQLSITKGRKSVSSSPPRYIRSCTWTFKFDCCFQTKVVTKTLLRPYPQHWILKLSRFLRILYIIFKLEWENCNMDSAMKVGSEDTFNQGFSI